MKTGDVVSSMIKLLYRLPIGAIFITNEVDALDPEDLSNWDAKRLHQNHYRSASS